MRAVILVMATVALWMPEVHAADGFTVQTVAIQDYKAVFATVESERVVPARVRTGGTIVGLSVREGDHVEQGQVVAVIADAKLGLQVASVDAQIAGLKAQLATDVAGRLLQ